MEIRHATEHDYELYCSLVSVFDRFFEALDPRLYRVPPPPGRSRQDYELFWKGPDKGVLLAFENGVAAGLANYQIGPVDYPMMLPRKVFFISIVAVAEGRQRRGIGRALMAAMKKIAVEQGCDDIELFVNIRNLAALEFYQALGLRAREHAMTMRVKEG